MIPLTSPRFLAAGLALMLALASANPLHAEDGAGPTPLPDAKDEAAWPGTGPIRVFGWMIDNRNSFWKNRDKDQGTVVFVGDSLTAGWKDLATAFPNLKVANRGVGGDVSRGLLFRFKEDVLALKPRAIVILIGANDLSAHAPTEGIESNIKEIIAQAREFDPKVPIVLCTIPSRNSKEAPTKPGATEEVNTRIKSVVMGASDPNLAGFDLNSVTATPDGAIIPEDFAKDGVHLAAPGYQAWAKGLAPVLVKLGVK